MKTNLIPKQKHSSGDDTLALSKALKRSPNLSTVFLLIYENNRLNLNQIADYLKRSTGQAYMLCDRLNKFGVLKKVEGKGIFLFNKELDKDTQKSLIKDAQEGIIK